MPIQQFYCNSEVCDYNEEKYISIEKELPTTCPYCEKETLKVRFGSFIFFDNTPKTVGTFAERRTIVEKGMVEDSRAEFAQTNPIAKQREKVKSEAPFWRPNTTGPDMSLARMTPEQQKRYILEGKK